MLETVQKTAEGINAQIRDINAATDPNYQKLTPLIISSEQGLEEKIKADNTLKSLGGATPPAPTTGASPAPTPEPTQPSAGSRLSREDASRLFGTDFTGVTMNPDGTFTPDTAALGRIPGQATPAPAKSQEQQELDDSGKELERLKNELSQYTISDAQLQNTISNITARWDARISQMKDINARRERAFETTGLRLGSRYTGGKAGTFGGIVAAEERQGLIRIGELEAQKQEAILGAQEAARKNNWTLYSKQVELAEKAHEEKLKAVQKLNEAQKKQDEELKKESQKQTRAFAISDVIAQGVTDREEIFKIMNYDDEGKLVGDISLKEIDDILGTQKTETLPSDLRTYDELKRRGEIPAGMTFTKWQAEQKASGDTGAKKEETRKEEYSAAEEVVKNNPDASPEELESAIRSRATELSDGDIKAIIKAENARFLTKDYFSKLLGTEALEKAAIEAGNSTGVWPFRTADTETYLTNLEGTINTYREAGYSDQEILELMQKQK